MSIEFEYELDINGHIIKAYIEAEGSIDTDPDYGADADGNRGVKRHFLEDFSFKVFDSRGNEITAKLREKFSMEYKWAESRAEDELWSQFENE